MFLGIIGFIIVGLIAGFVARAVVPGDDSMSIPATIGLGMAGSLVGWFLGVLITGAKFSDGISPAGIIGSIFGAIVVLLAYRMFVKGNAQTT